MHFLQYVKLMADRKQEFYLPEKHAPVIVFYSDKTGCKKLRQSTNPLHLSKIFYHRINFTVSALVVRDANIAFLKTIEILNLIP